MSAKLLALALAAFAAFSVAASVPYFPERLSDVRAFYCAGVTVMLHADPYHEHPLLECERAVRAPLLSPLRWDVAVPVPFPGYVLALFAALALLPFPVAAGFWLLGSSVAIVAAVVLVARTTRTPLAAAAIVVGFPTVVVALPLGQITPFVLLSIAACGSLLQARRPHCAALAALGALLDPHVGVAVIIGLGIAAPRTRGVLLAGGLAVLGLGLSVSNPRQELEYVQTVVPAHALANVADALQFSTTNAAYLAGLPSASAVTLGSVWYGVAVVCGALVALALQRRLGRAAAAYIPPAFAVFGGTHTHIAQLELAIPAFLLLCSTLAGNRRVVCVATTFVAALPWLALGPFPMLFALSALSAFVFARAMSIGVHATWFGLTTLTAQVALFVAIVRWHSDRGAIDVRVTGNPLAEVAWQILVVARNVPPEYGYLFAKAPTVMAFCALLCALVYAALQPRAVVVEC